MESRVLLAGLQAHPGSSMGLSLLPQMAKRMLGLHGDHGPASRGAGDAVDRAGPSDATIAGVLGSEAPFSPGATSSVPWVSYTPLPSALLCTHGRP